MRDKNRSICIKHHSPRRDKCGGSVMGRNGNWLESFRLIFFRPILPTHFSESFLAFKFFSRKTCAMRGFSASSATLRPFLTLVETDFALILTYYFDMEHRTCHEAISKINRSLVSQIYFELLFGAIIMRIM